MAKKQTFTDRTPSDLARFVEEKREELRRLSFAVAGSKNANVKLARTLRKDIARALTVLNAKVTPRQNRSK
jgi:ribosomal protein L29